MSKLKTQYARQYIDAWRKFLNGVSVVEYGSPEAALDALKELARNDSPVARVMSEVVKQTNISKPRSFWAKINPFSATKSKTGAAVAAQIENDFQTVIRFVSGESGGGDQMTQYLKTLTEVRDILSDASVDGWPQAAKRLLSNNDPNSLTKFESQQMKPLIEQVKSKSGAGKDAGTLLEQPLGNLRKLLLASNVDQMDREWRDRLQIAAQRLEQGYPFTPSNADAPLADFARMFNPVDGQFWVFFRQNLESYFEEDAGARWKLREGSKLRPSDGFVAYVNGDPSGRTTLANAITDARAGAEQLYDANFAGQSNVRFQMTSSGLTAGTSNPAFPYPRTENWQKAIGAHNFWISADVEAATIQPGDLQRFTMQLTLHVEDRYNFNPGAHDIATGIPDSENGTFEITGLAHQYMNYSTLRRSLEWTAVDGYAGALQVSPQDPGRQRQPADNLRIRNRL